MKFKSLLFFCIAVLLSTQALVVAQSQIPQFRYNENYITGLSSPVLLTHAGDGTHRKFIVEKAGRIRVVPFNSRTPTLFMDISGRVANSGEQGLLGLAFHPNFAQNGYFFVYYTKSGDGAVIVSRFSAINNNTAGDASSERVLLTINQPYANHNGGGLAFSPVDGYLYIGTGDGGSGNDPGNRAQNINELNGKFLRINPDVSGVNTNPAYTNPADNPYVGVAGADEIYAIGLRNPWRWSFDRGGTNQLWAGDVGQSAREEVNIITKGGNYGWRVYEGTNCTGIDPSLCNPANFIMPVFQFNTGGARCSVIGGQVYRGNKNALPRGAYVFGDYCSGEILMWHNSTQTVLRDTPRQITAINEDEEGEIYVVHFNGVIGKIEGNKPKIDFDGDFKTDRSVYRPSNSTWYRYYSANNSIDISVFGLPGDIPAPKDYDGDHISDLAVFRPSTAHWYVLRSTDFTVQSQWWGEDGDVPVPADYDGDGKADFAIFRPSDGSWYVISSEQNAFYTLNWGFGTDIPVPGDYDGDGHDDIAIWRPSTGEWWTIHSSDNSINTFVFGVEGDIPAPADYDGDGRVGQALFRASESRWYIRRTLENQITWVTWGVEGDIPVPGDYDGDTKEDVAIFRPSDGSWYIIGSSNGQILPVVKWGEPGDISLPSLATR